MKYYKGLGLRKGLMGIEKGTSNLALCGAAKQVNEHEVTECRYASED